MDTLDEEPLILEVMTGGRTYRATNSRAGRNRGEKKLYSTRMWESGKLVQHYDLLELFFEDRSGDAVYCEASLDIVAWPDAFSLNLDLMPGTFAWTNALVRIRLGDRQVEERVEGHWAPDDMRRFTLRYTLDSPAPAPEKIAVQLSRPAQEMTVPFDEGYGCYAARVTNLRHKGSRELQEGRVYDEFELLIENQTGADAVVPFLLDLSGPLNITGLCPILCDEKGVPTGIPVQLSKNWHHEELGPYLRAFTMIPAKPGISDYKLRIVYGFYGTLPSASHAIAHR